MPTLVDPAVNARRLQDAMLAGQLSATTLPPDDYVSLGDDLVYLGPWERLMVEGYTSGHVLARCPRCAERAMTSYSPPSTPWPRCMVCLPEPAPRLECLSDLALVRHKKPGQPRTKTQLRLDGCVLVPNWRPPPPT